MFKKCYYPSIIFKRTRQSLNLPQTSFLPCNICRNSDNRETKCDISFGWYEKKKDLPATSSCPFHSSFPINFSKIAFVFVRQEYQREHFLLSDYNLKLCELEVFPNNNLNYFTIKDYDIFESEEELCKYIKVVWWLYLIWGEVIFTHAE